MRIATSQFGAQLEFSPEPLTPLGRKLIGLALDLALSRSLQD